MRVRLFGEWILLLTAVLALVGSGLPLLPRARTAARLLAVAENPPAIAAIRLPQVLTPERVEAEINAAIAAEDDDLAQSILDLADSHGVMVAPDRRARVAAMQNGASYRAARAFAAGAATGEAETAAGLAGVLAADLSGLGDIRDIAREGPICARGEACDTLVLGLATVGLATNAATIASAGAATPLRAGVTILKTARKLGRLPAPLVAALTRMVRAAVDPEAVRVLVRAGGRLDAAGLTAAARSAVRPDALRGLRDLGGNVYGLYASAGPRGVLQVLGLARTPGEIARAERLALRFGTRTRATLKLLDRSALVLGRELAALARTVLFALAWAFGLALFCRRLGTALGRWLWRRPASVRLKPMSDSVVAFAEGRHGRDATDRPEADRAEPVGVGGPELPAALSSPGSRRMPDLDPAMHTIPAVPIIGRYGPTQACEASGPLNPHDAGVRIVAIGGALPDWAAPSSAPFAEDKIELMVVHGPPSRSAAREDGRRSDASAPQLRLIVCDETLVDCPLDVREGMTAVVRISTRPHDRDTVARALAACAHGGGLLIGTDAGDLQRVAGVEPGRAGRGRAIVIPGRADAGLGESAGSAVAKLTAAGFDGGRLMIQLVAAPDAAAIDLAALDACAAAVIRSDADRDWILSCAMTDRTALVIVAFDRPAPVPAEVDPTAGSLPDRSP